jgi:serine/threonine-protein kinase RsbW
VSAVRELRCPGTPACLDAVQDALELLWADAPGVDGTDRVLFETALVEIVGNIVEHARTTSGDAVSLALTLSVDAGSVRARLQDDGGWPPQEADPATARMPADELAESGRGLAMASAVAEVHHTRRSAGNVWTVVRHRTG